MLSPMLYHQPTPTHLPAARLPGLVAALAIVIGCQQPQSPDAQAAGPVPITSPTLSQGGGSGGAVISRGTVATGFIIADQEQGLTTVIGVTFEDLRRLCAGEAVLPEIAALIVERPTGAVKFQLKSDALPVVVWQVLSDDACGVLATTAPYAEGLAGLRLTDNDAGDFPVSPGGNTSILHAVGKVESVMTGEELHYQAAAHFFLPRGATSFDDLRFARSRIQLR
jgi:hypothetical protein